MFTKAFIFALAASPLVAAHGKVASVTGDAGGNGTALGIMGGVVPGPGRNKVTEVDTTVFGKTKIQSDGLGKTTGNGQNSVSMIKSVMAQSGDTLPQVSANGGSLSGVFHIVTTDGAGPIQGCIDPTGTGSFSQCDPITPDTQVPGKNGNIKATRARSVGELFTRSMDKLMKRASNVNTDHPMSFSIPAGTTCTGSMGGVENVCLMKIANSNRAGPFGGVVPFQVAANGTATPVAGASAAGAAASSTKSTGNNKSSSKNSKRAARRAASFEA